jgi:hypothetical protein
MARWDVALALYYYCTYLKLASAECNMHCDALQQFKDDKQTNKISCKFTRDKVVQSHCNCVTRPGTRQRQQRVSM